jgi:DeoR/GlpR family transcriptional regulator of sugar metabolism
MFDSLSPREEGIIQKIMENPRVSVADLAKGFGVSEVTIRNDLNDMAEQGLIVRTRGGGMPAFHPSILERQRINHAGKLRIAKAAAKMIESGDEIMLVGGTTTSLIPRHLYGKRDIKMVTNSTYLLPYARTNMGLKITFTGGEFRPENEVMVGPATLRALKQFHVATAFLGADGIQPDKGVTADSVEIAEVVRTMAAQAERLVLLADSSKTLRAGFAYIMPLEKVHTFITDKDIRPEVANAIRKAGVQLITV